ncbi:MAG TPA: amino acid adenylation domain-containing protein [Pyrinomonadaceae bacterium]|nr:amino acid adenylation domain-containing protein [Pyrinomonadaceae bacterium]
MNPETEDKAGSGADARSQMSAAKRALLEKRLAGRGQDAPDKQAIGRRSLIGPPPLSFSQQRLWFLSQLEPELVAYNISEAVRLAGRLDVAVLNWCFNEIVRRHESLRTSFDVIAGHPVQVIASALELSIPVFDLSQFPDEERDVEALRLSRVETERPFDLVRGPLIRAVLLRLRADEHALIVTMHHIVSDGWSQGVLKNELGALYRARIMGQPSPLAELPIQYADFSEWQREWVSGAVLDQQLNYWRDRLAGAPPFIELPADKARPAAMSYQGATFLFELSTELSEALAALSRREGATLFMTLLAGFKTLLYLYSDQSDIVIGTPVANRNREEVESLIGFFVNTLVLRTDVSGDPAFRELLARVREVSLGAQAHQDLPFELLVAELQINRETNRNPLFQIAFDFQNTPAPALEFPGLTLHRHEFTATTTRFDLELHLTSVPAGIIGALVYSTELFEESTIRSFAERFRMLLEAVVANPDRRVSQIDLLTRLERKKLLDDWNDTARAYPIQSCIPDLFEAWAGRTPDNIALASGEVNITYAELNQRANQLAHYLKSYGVGEETRVGIHLERSVEMVVAVLAVLKAGATYVALDPSYPDQRLLFMLDDADVALVLTVESLEESLPAHPAPVILLDSDWPLIAVAGEHNPERNASSEQLAYIVYTSGSTGRPKGVAVPHRGVVRLVSGNDYASFGPDEVFLQFAPLTFDASTFEIWGALLNGSQLVLMPPGLASLQDLGRALQQHRVTTLWLTAGLFHQMVDEQLPALSELRQLLAGGDVLSPAHVKRFLASRSCRLINGYGPTENTTFTCCHVMDQPLEFARSVPIGQAIANTQILILDKSQRLCPPGFAGELFTGGDGLARGYHGQAGLTADKFIPNAFSDVSGTRLYRTGDLVRQLADGNIEFLGRADEQVKVRGFRVELGEIEAVLSRAPGVRQSIVITRDYDGDKRLVAYVVGEQSSISVDRLQKTLRESLPDHLIPSTFVILDELPLTPNGKVDRRALPAPAEIQAQSDDGYVAPRTPIEELLAGIWAEVLKIERVSTDDNFFELGGHSLLVTRLVSRAQAHFGVELPLKLFFESSTLASQAAQVEAALRTDNGLHAPPIVPVSRDENLPLSYSQQRLWFLYQLEPSTSAYNIPTAVRLRGALNSAALARTMNEVVRRHEILRTHYGTIENKPMQFVGLPDDIKLELSDFSELPESERELSMLRLAAEEARRPFDLTRGPLFRACLVRLGPEEHVLVLTVHHIVSDGWSQGVLVREVGTLYKAFSEGEESPLGELPVQYADFARLQRNWLVGDVLDKHLDYWRRQLAGPLPILELPADRPRPEVQSFRGSTLTVHLPPTLSESLNQICRSEGVTLFMLLLAAFKVLLHRYTGQDDIVIGAPIANRNRVEIEGLIGFFVNTLVLRTDLSGDPDFRELLARLRKVTLEAYAHQDMPFELLVEELQPERDLSRNPLFQVMFQLENTPKEELPLPGLTLSPVDVEGVASQFDLSVDVVESEYGLSVTAEYSTDLFEAATMRRLLDRWRVLLEGIAAEPARRLSALPLMDEIERRRVEVEWNETVKPYQTSCVSELFEARVERSAGAVAIVCDGVCLTFAELNHRANQLAHHLSAAGAGPEVPVAVMLERSTEMVVALLAILKAGGAYVPLDPSYPATRLAFVLDDVQAPLIVTQQSLLEKIPSQHPAQVVCVDRDAASIATGPTDNLPSRATPDNLAYVIYTSGSTGLPKGVVVSNRALSNHCFAVAEEFELRSSDRVLQFASLSFDVAGEELFPTLLAGAAVVIPRERLLDAGQLRRLIEHERVSVLNLPAQFWQEWLEGLELAGASWPECVRLMIAGSEKISREGIARWRKLTSSKTVLLNAYGVTEATITSTLYRPNANVDQSSGADWLPIGRPVANTQTYVLDRHLESVPIGFVGELYLGGAALARGYHARASLTAERFIPNPFSSVPGSRLYRTGDLARFLADGNIEFVGRADEQVKLRGYRIELGEIEAVLNSAPGVQRAAVLLREETSGDKRLIAYVTQKRFDISTEPSDSALETEQLAQWKTVHDDEIFNETVVDRDPAFNISGWNSSYTGEPIPATEMREWVDDAVERVLAEKPRRVLEIGCGTGLMMFRIASHCEHYLGTDFSPAALSYIRNQLGDALPQVSLSERNADDFTGVEPASWDAVVINSVVQYFPAVDYLLRVLRGAIDAVAPGGSVFIGDVRSLPLLDAFHASIELHKAEARLSLMQLRQRIARRVDQEEELVIDPRFFTALKTHLPRIRSVRIEPKRGHYRNELTQFRYQVTIHVGDTETVPADLSWIDWSTCCWNLAELRRQLIEAEPQTLALSNVANARLDAAVRSSGLIATADDRQTPAELKEIVRTATGEGIDPEELYALGNELSYEVHLSWARHSADGSFDLLLRRAGAIAPGVHFPEATGSKALPDYANHPLRGKQARQFGPQLRSFLKERLPEHMVPASFVIMDELPLLPNGKIDRRALPAPDAVRPELAGAFVAPRTRTEQSLADVWSDLLGLPQVGIHDNFFDLGGHSLLSTQLTSRVRELFQIELPLREVFQQPTIAQLAIAIEQARDQNQLVSAATITPVSREARRRSRPANV